MGRYSAYQSYDSDGFPEHWELMRLRFALTLNPSKNEITLSDSELVSFVPMDAVGENGGIRLDEHKELGDIGSGYTYFRDNDVVVAKITPCFENGKGAIAKGLTNGFAFGTTELYVLRADLELLEPDFLFYLTVSDWFRDLGESEMYGAGGQKRVPEDFIKNLITGIPPKNEQLTIVEFLNHKTAQIDALIAKKRSLLEKLAEQRTTLISQAVTKGLDSSVATRDSGAAWLGKIPKHWSTSRVKFVAKVGNGSTPSRDNPDYWFDGDFPWLNSSVVNREVVDSADQFVTGVALKECHLPIIEPPAVLVGITGQGKTRGMSSKLTFRATINQHLVYVKPYGDSINVDYLHHIFERAYAYLRNESDAGGSTKGAITCSQIENLAIPLPPLAEQEQIVRFVDADYSRISRLQKKIKAALQRLQEYRSALITNAVTGKIDVRDFRIPNTTEQREVAHG